MSNQNIKGKIEAILFATGEPVDVLKVAKFFKISKEDLDIEIEKLKEDYLSRKAGLTIIKKAGKIQLSSEPDFGEVVMKFMKKEIGEELSTAASEVLAVIAYRGPLTRAEIEYIRGVNCSFTIRNLAMRGLVDRKENPNDSRSYLYEVSFDFMNSLGIKKMQDLPGYEELIKKEKTKIDEIQNKN